MIANQQLTAPDMTFAPIGREEYVRRTMDNGRKKPRQRLGELGNRNQKKWGAQNRKDQGTSYDRSSAQSSLLTPGEDSCSRQSSVIGKSPVTS
jgi:hypothetical protein